MTKEQCKKQVCDAIDRAAEQIYTLAGDTQMGEKFEEFYPDKKALKELMIEVFYREVEL